jgi:glycolate oxidase FAD binding subunit
MSSSAREPVQITSVEDVVDVIRQQTAGAQSITAARQASDDCLRLELQGFNQVVDYPARDMTVTVEAGMSLGDLTSLLNMENQQLPVDVADPTMSVGAFVAADLAGPRQYGYGTLRDYLIGMEAVDGQGRVFHAGGRVVKNVAGYDLCRLAVGSRGTIGILTQLTFKLRPAPEQFVIESWEYSDRKHIAQALETLNTSAARPVMIDLACGGDSKWTLFVGVDGTQDVCDWQVSQLKDELPAGLRSASMTTDSSSSLSWCAAIAKLRIAADTSTVVQTLPSSVPDVCHTISQHSATAHCHAGNGLILVSGENSSLTAALQQQVQQHHGTVMPSAQSAGEYRRDASWSARTISAFDPNRVFA